VEALNLNKFVSQSEKAVRASFRHRNKAVSIGLQKLTPVKIWHQTVWHAPESGVEFMASIIWHWFLERMSVLTAVHTGTVVLLVSDLAGSRCWSDGMWEAVQRMSDLQCSLWSLYLWPPVIIS